MCYPWVRGRVVQQLEASFAESARLEAEIRAKTSEGSSMARKKSAAANAKESDPARPGRPSPARREPAADDLPASYAALLNDLKGRIRTAQVKAVLAVNRELIGLYWDIGRAIVERQKAEGWGKSIVNRLAADLQKEFPGESGFSPGNVWRMRAFYLAWTEEARDIASLVSQGDWDKLQQAAGELPRPILARFARIGRSNSAASCGRNPLVP